MNLCKKNKVHHPVEAFPSFTQMTALGRLQVTVVQRYQRNTGYRVLLDIF